MSENMHLQKKVMDQEIWGDALEFDRTMIEVIDFWSLSENSHACNLCNSGI